MSSALAAAEIEIRNDLAPHLESLKPLYVLDRYEAMLDEEEASFLPEIQIVKLTGPISKGDAAALEAMEERIFSEGNFTWSLVLESQGGSFQEGIQMGEYLREIHHSSDPSLRGVYVLDGDSCLSACALIFALAEGARYLETGARLGFHMGTVSQALAEQKMPLGQGMNLTYDIVAAYTKLLTLVANPPLLLQEALRHRTPESFYFVTSPEIAYDLGFIPVSSGPLVKPLPAKNLFAADIKGLCEKILFSSPLLTSFAADEYGDTSPPMKDGESFTAFLIAQNTKSLSPRFISGESCHLGTDEADNLLLEVRLDSPPCVNSFEAVEESGICVTDEEPYTYATTAMFADAAGCQQGQFQTSYENWKELEGTWQIEDDGIRTLLAHTELRQEPSLNAALGESLAAGQSIQILECHISAEMNPVWYKVETEVGQGWIPANGLAKNYARFRAATHMNSDETAETSH